MNTTCAVYRLPDLPPVLLVEMLANLERDGVVPLATTEVRQALWRSGGAHSRLAVRLNAAVNDYAAEVISL